MTRRERVAHGQVELLDRRTRVAAENATSVPPAFDELAQRGRAFLLQAARVLRRQLGEVAHLAVLALGLAGRDDFRGHVGQDDRVERGGELAGADGLVVEGLRLEAVLLEHEARPALVHRGGPGLVEAHARRGQRLDRARGTPATGVQR